jgi:hypothetical protein
MTLAQLAPQEQDIDLASIALTTPDVEDAGFTGYARFGGGPGDLGATAFELIFYQNQDDVFETFDDAGFQGSFIQFFQQPGDLEEEDLPDREIAAWVYLFEDAAGAADAWAVISDESEREDPAEDLEDAGQGLGDESEFSVMANTSHRFFGDVPHTVLELEILSDRLVLEVSLYIFEGPEAGELDVDEADVSGVEALGERFLERADAAVEGDAPNLSPLIMTLESEATVLPYRSYLVLDGEAMRVVGETEEAFADRAAGLEERGTVHYLRNEQFLTDINTGEPEVRFYTTIQGFADEEAASVYMDDLSLLSQTDRRTEGTWEDVEAEEVEDLGDEASAVTMTGERASGEAYVLNALFIRHGDTVVSLWIDASTGVIDEDSAVSTDTLIELGEIQAECLEEDICAESVVPMPAGVQDFLDYVLEEGS